MRVRRLAPGAARPEGGDDLLLVVPDRATAVKLRGRRPAAHVIVAAERLPFADGLLDEVVDEHALSPRGVAEDARVVRAGGRVALVADAKAGGGLAVVLGGLWKRPRPPLAPTDASAWLLAAGCEELTQTSPRDGLVVSEGRVRSGASAPARP